MTEVETLAAVEEIKKLKARYIRCLDTKDWAGFKNVFTPDAIGDYVESEIDPLSGRRIQDDLIAAGHPERKLVYKGGADIAKSISTAVGTQVTVHHIFSPEIEVLTPTTAKGIWAIEDIIKWNVDEQGIKRGIHGYGHYHETYEKASGEWRIKSVRVSRLVIDFY